MPLSPAQEQVEHELRVELMTVNVEKLRADMRWEARKFGLQLAATIAVSVGATLAAVSYFGPRQAAPQMIYIQPAPK